MTQLLIGWLILMAWIWSERGRVSTRELAFVAALGTACLAVVVIIAK